MWALSSPLGSSPDDNYHQTTIWCVGASSSTSPDTCRVTGTSATTGGRVVEVPALVGTPNCYAFVPTESGACQRPLEGQEVSTEAIDNGTYPGGFYRVMHLLVQDSIPESVLAMRMLNVTLAALLMGAIALVSTTAVRRLMALTFAVVLMPLGWFILASVNPSSWALSGLTAYGFALHTVLLLDGREDRVRRIVAGVLGVLALAMALAARGDAPAYAGVITVALCALHARTILAHKKLLVIPAVVAAVCLWRVLVAAQVASIAGASAETDRTLSEVVPNLLLEFPALFSGMFGYAFGLGWLDTAVHSITAYPVALIVGFLGLTGLGRMAWPKAVAAAIVFTPMLALPMLTLVRTRLIVGESVQPRYILPLMPMLLAILLLDRTADRVVGLSRVQSVMIALALTVANAAAVYANIRRYVTGTDGPTMIDSLEWWWQSAPSPDTVTIAAGVSFAVFVAPIVVMHWRRLPQEAPPSSPVTEEIA
ncbi:DUF2142 domain-containing protein [Nocardioides baculatus]|nr:DUF2142 domain-containing protein [Nocardioides baculatus]